MKIANVSDTARWVATYRAMETERPDAIFHDLFARRLAGAQGQAIVDAMPKGRERAWAMIVRTAIFDEMILADIHERCVDLVLNLAAGLDARPWRLPLPEGLRWVDVDLPEILGHKTNLMRDEQPHCRYEAVTADLSDGIFRPALVAQLTADAKVALVITEGLLIYLPPEQVGNSPVTWPHRLRCARGFWTSESVSAGHHATRLGQAGGCGQGSLLICPRRRVSLL